MVISSGQLFNLQFFKGILSFELSCVGFSSLLHMTWMTKWLRRWSSWERRWRLWWIVSKTRKKRYCTDTDAGHKVMQTSNSYLHKVPQTLNLNTGLDIYTKSYRLQIHILALISAQSLTEFKFKYWPWYIHKILQTSNLYAGLDICTKSYRLQIHILALISTQSLTDFKFIDWPRYLHKVCTDFTFICWPWCLHKVSQTSQVHIHVLILIST